MLVTEKLTVTLAKISTMDLIVCLQENIISPCEKTTCDLFLQKQNCFIFRLASALHFGILIYAHNPLFLSR